MTARGYGGAVRSPRVEPVVVPPATVTGADNGLTLNGTLVQLGGPLIQPTDINLGGQPFTVSSGFGGNLIFLDDTFGSILATFGFDSGFPQPSFIQFEADNANIFVGQYQALIITDSLGTFWFGDTLAAVNGTRMEIDDAATNINFRSLSGQMLILDQMAQQYAMGDLSLIGNGVVFQIDNGANEARIQNSSGNLLYISAGVGLFFLGDDALASGLAMDTAGRVYNIQDNGSPLFQGVFNGANPEVSIGDVNAVANGLFLQVDDATGIVRVQNGGMTAAMEINGVAGFTGTVAAPATITVNGGIVTNVA